MKRNSKEKNPPAFIPPVVEIARDAAKAILDVYATDFSVEDKADRSPVTAADMAAHRIICAGLGALTPHIPILSEESADIAFSIRRQWRQYWLVDPLDGTREFVKRNGEFTVNIALIEKNQPVMGVVYVPVSKVCYFAAKDMGAYRQEPGRDAVKISTRSTQESRFIAAGSRSHGSEQQRQFFASLGEKVEIIAIGSSLKLCLIAEGKADIYPRFGPTSEWDTAAAHCIIEQAGGLVTDTALQPLRYNTKDALLNPHFLALADRGFDWRPYLAKAMQNPARRPA